MKTHYIDNKRFEELITAYQQDPRSCEDELFQMFDLLIGNIINSFSFKLDFDDGLFVNDDLHKKILIEKIREYKPDIVLTNAPSDRHPDHARASQLTIDSCFLAGLEKIDTNQEVWRPKAIYHYIQFNNLSPDFVVDISSYFDQKIMAVKEYKSQFFDPDSKESNTIISSQEFLDSIEYRAKDLGRQTSCDYAEGFITHQLPKINLLNDFK